MEEADSKVEQHRDALASEMFSLLRKESELAQYMLQLLKLQRAYHESALKNLEKVIPKLEQRIGMCICIFSFIISLQIMLHKVDCLWLCEPVLDENIYIFVLNYFEA